MTLGLGAAVCVATLTACGGSTITEVSGPDEVRCQASVTPPPAFPATGSRVTLTVSAARECTWSATSDTSWAEVSPASGQGEASITVTVAPNPNTQPRTGAIVVNGNRLSLSQEPAPCRYQLSRSTARMSHHAGRLSVAVSTTDGCSWRASSNAQWARVVPESGAGSGTVQVEVSVNDGPARTALIEVAGRTVTLTQLSAADPGAPDPDPGPDPPDPVPPPANPLCVFAIDDDSESFDSDGGDGHVRVITLPSCAWAASSKAAWIEITSAPTGSGTATVHYRVAPNPVTSDRTGVITVGGRAHTVQQDGAPPEAKKVRKIELEGRVSNVSGSCPAVTFMLEGRSVFTDNQTKFKDGGCGRLRNGLEVEVEGDLLTDGRVRAKEVEIDD